MLEKAIVILSLIQIVISVSEAYVIRSHLNNMGVNTPNLYTDSPRWRVIFGIL